MKSKKGKITAPQIGKIFKDLAAKKNPKGGAQPGTLLSSAGKLGEKSCGGEKGCGAKLGA
jgi:hypothetical protein